MPVYGILCYNMIPRFCPLTRLSGAPYNLKTWGGQTCASKLTTQRRWDNGCWKEAREMSRTALHHLCDCWSNVQSPALPASHLGQTAPLQTIFFSHWHKIPMLGGTGRGGSKTKTRPSRIPAALFCVGSHLEPCCCCRKAVGYRCWDRQSAKA